MLSLIAKLKTFKHWGAILFFATSFVVMYFLSTHSYDPCAHRFERIRPAVWSGDEPHYLIIISSILADGDLSLTNNYQSARFGRLDAGQEFRGKNLDHHTLIQDVHTHKGMLWPKMFGQGTPIECDPGDLSCVGFVRISQEFSDYTPASSDYRELPAHPLPFPVLLTMLLKIAGAQMDQVEPFSIYVQVFLSWLVGIITYACALKTGLRSTASLAAVSLLFYASSWLVYSHNLYPATFMGLLLMVALWAFLSRRFAIAVIFLTIASVQSEAFVVIFPAWVLFLFFSAEKKSAAIFAGMGLISLAVASLISYLLLGKVTLRFGLFFFDLVPWRTFLAKERGLWLFVPWSVAAFCFLILSFVYRNLDVTRTLRIIATGILPVAMVYMIIPHTGEMCYGPRYWVPYLPWLSLAFVLGAKNFRHMRSIWIRASLITLVALSMVIAATAAILSPAMVPFWEKPPWYASRILWQTYHQTSPNASCPRGDVQFWVGSGCNNPDRKSARLTLPTAVRSTSFAIVSRLACSAAILDGAEVMRLRFYDVDGSIQTQSIVAGRDSSEWAFDCASVLPEMRHRRASVFADYSSKLPDGPCVGHFYFTKYALGGVKHIKAIDFEWVGGPGGIILDKLGLIDEKAKSLYPIDAGLLGP